MTVIKPLHTFTLLIRSHAGEEGTDEGTFLPPTMKIAPYRSEVTFLPSPVRVVTLQEIKKSAKEMKGSKGDRFYALLALRGALESKDELALAKAKERMERVYQVREKEYADDQARNLALKFGFTMGEKSNPVSLGIRLPETEAHEFNLLKNWPDLRPSPRALGDASRLLSYAVSERVTRARIVLWWAAGDFMPAIYCEDIEACLYAHTFLVAPTGRIGWRICPHCTEPFFQKRPNQDYCRPAHREAHRVARFRHKQNQEVSEKKINRRKDGTEKTR